MIRFLLWIIFIVCILESSQVSGNVFNQTWSLIATSNVTFPARDTSATIYLDESVFVIAGANSTYVFDDVYVSVTSGASWDLAAAHAPFGPRTGHAVVVNHLNQILLVAGGKAKNNDPHETILQRDVWLSEDGGNWTQIVTSAPWLPRAGHSLVLFGERVFLLAGFAETALHDVWYSEDGGYTWNPIANGAPWPSRAYFGALVANDMLYIMGGTDFQLGPLNDVWQTQNGEAWRPLLSTNSSTRWASRSNFGCIFLGDKFWVMGGLNAPQAPGIFRDVWVSSDANDWYLVQDITPMGRIAEIGVVSTDQYRMLVVGGATDISHTTKIQHQNDHKLAPSPNGLPKESSDDYTSNIFANTLNLFCTNEDLVCHGHGNCTRNHTETSTAYAVESYSREKMFTSTRPSCNCSTGWIGATCGKPLCGPDTCKHGECATSPGDNSHLCICFHGWTGIYCDTGICSHGCEHGTCTAPDVCTCKHGWHGASCDVYENGLHKLGHFFDANAQILMPIIAVLLIGVTIAYGFWANYYRLKEQPSDYVHVNTPDDFMVQDISFSYGTFTPKS